MMKKVFVTGGTGMIGLAFIRLCIRENIDVYVLVREGSVHLKRLPKSEKVHMIKGDLKHLDHIDTLSISPCDVFYHFGWIGTVRNDRNKVELQEENIPILLQALNLAKQLKCHSLERDLRQNMEYLVITWQGLIQQLIPSLHMVFANWLRQG